MAAAVSAPRLAGPREVALLLDFDGTLVDIAPAPDLVVIPDTLADNLRALRDRLDGALAIVTGRPLDDIDRFLPGVVGTVAAEHGAILRRRAGETAELARLAPVPAEWREAAQRIADATEGVRLERKQTGFVLHYRAAPDSGPSLRAGLDRLVAGHEDDFHILAAKMAWELRASGADKGSAVAAIMEAAPFAGRSPVFIGDDVTDEHGIEAARRLGGTGFLVADAFGEPADVRGWLGRLARGEDGAWEG